MAARSIPRVAGWLTAVVGASNLVSALSPELPARLAPLADRVPRGLVVAAHAAVLPAGLALLVLSYHLARRRRRALWLAVAVLAVLGELAIVRGAGVPDTVVSWTAAALLVGHRRAFVVEHEGAAPRRLCALVAAVLAGSGAAVLVGAHVASPDPTLALDLHEWVALLALQPGPLRYGDPFDWLPLGVGLLSVGGGLAAAWVLFRPLRAVVGPQPERLRAVARQLVHAHGSDTLSAFKLRGDVQRLVSDDGRAFVAYRLQSGVLLLSGDPVGPGDAVPALLREVTAFAERHGLRVGAIAASAAFAEQARRAGLSAFYMGDEAIVGTAGFSLDGRVRKKVRQAVGRVERAGYRHEVRTVGQLSGAEVAELEAVSERWRGDAAEIGFSMAMDGLRGEHVADSVVIVARDATGAARGFLHFVPAYGRSAMSLSSMRRDRDTPNGLTEYLIVRAIEELGARGWAELSLNFAAFARWQHSPVGRVERALAGVARRATYFQFERLYRFNDKFSPRWQPRYLLHEGPTALPRTALAALWAEGQMPRPAVPRRGARRG